MFTSASPVRDPHSNRRHEPRWAAYSVGVVLLPLLLMCFLLWVASTPWFMQHNANPGLRAIGYGLTLVHEDCDVVLYGDSSALTAYDPAIIQSITGLKACNVAEGGTITGVVGTYPLDVYLSRNKRPRYLAMMLTPSIFRPNPQWMEDTKPEGYTYVLQFIRGERLFYCLLRQPLGTVRYASWVGQRLVADFLGRVEGTNPDNPAKDGGADRRRRHGITTFPLPTETKCVRTGYRIPAESIHGDPEGVAAVHRKYGADGTQLIINVAPVPTCDVLQGTYRKVLAGEHDNQFERLPISWFNSEDVHFNGTGADYLSVELAEQILDRERKRAGDGTAGKP
jgi:hypothetical protein